VKDQCARAEVLAGAIALGEASSAERDDYRSHIATCASCLHSLGGEREIERVMSVVAQAKESETWEPQARRATSRARGTMWRLGTAFGVAAAALAISIALHALLAANVRAPAVIAKSIPAPVFHASAFHVALEHRARSTPARIAKARPAHPRSIANVHPAITISHTVITRHGNAVTQTTTQTTEIAYAPPVTHAQAPQSNVPIWRRNEAMPVSPQRVLTSTPAPLLTPGRAESIAVAPITVIHDVTPLGGDASINPHPPPIAYAQGAEGTTAFEVYVDERGLPVKCTITKSSGYLSLDNAVCKAAMAAHYSPRTVNGKPVPGVYRDAFTFRATEQDDNQL
jgi:TonB family protein